MTTNPSNVGEISSSSDSSTRFWDTIASYFFSNSTGKVPRLSWRLASIHGAVDQELQPDYHTEWKKLHRTSTDHRSAIEIDNTNMYSALTRLEPNIDDLSQAVTQPQQQQQQQQMKQLRHASKKVKAPTWQWPEWDMGLKHRTVVSIPIGPRNSGA